VGKIEICQTNILEKTSMRTTFFVDEFKPKFPELSRAELGRAELGTSMFNLKPSWIFFL
jgi:hypothetical protein